jgi:ectoine hydroxylase-related dioxygenase (phytanoyl-CoA dioxygenase family)
VELMLSDAERRQYEELGFFARESVFDAADLERLRAAAERVVERAGRAVVEAPVKASRDRTADYEIDGNRYVELADSTIQFEHREGTRTIRVIEPFHHLDPIFDALVEDPRIVAPLCGVLGADRIALWTDKINLKRPREGSGFRWHQDSPYWSHVCGHCDQLPNVLITLDDADRANGCFRVVPGSHRKGFLPGIQDETRLGPLFTDPSAFDAEQQWLAELPAGSLVVFSAHSVHGSEPNDSDRARRAIVLTYQPADHPMFKLERTRNFEIGNLRSGTMGNDSLAGSSS